MDSATLTPGFHHPVHDAARTFRTLLDAMARPGTIKAPPVALTPPAPMGTAMAATLLTLCDTDTPIALVGDLGTQQTRTFVGFHTGAPLCEAVVDAQFVFSQTNVALTTMRQGDQDFPDRSTTLIQEVSSLEGDGHVLKGPGIDGTRAFGTQLFDAAFLDEWRQNTMRFPLGVDLILTCGDRLAALPRTTQILQE